MRKRFSDDFKFKVAVEALKNEETAVEIAARFEISTSLVSKWKNELLNNGSKVFSKKRGPKKVEPTNDPSYLLHEIGILKVERDFLAKKYEQMQLRKKEK